MIINIKNKTDLITLDLRAKQLRYLRGFEQKGEIEFIPLSNDDIEGYNYLFKEDKKLFLETLREDIFNFTGIVVYIKDLKIERGFNL